MAHSKYEVPMTHDEMIALLESHRDGRCIQWRGKGWLEWRDETASGSPPKFHPQLEYRIKPATAIRNTS